MSAPARSGMVYLLALLVVLVISTIAVAMASGAGLRLRAQDGQVGRLAARHAALGVLRAVCNDLATAQTEGTTPGLLTVQATGETIGDCQVMLLGRDPSGERARFGLIPEAGKISLYALVDPDVPEYIRTALRNALSAAPGMSAAITAAIVDWQDEDDTPDKDGGAERNDGAYQGAKIPYAPRNAKVETIDELRLVRGVTDAVFFGEDTNGNGRLDPGEDTNGNGKLDPGLRDVVTLESREPRTAPQGGDRTLATNKGAVTVLIGKLITDTSRAKELSDEIGQLQTITNRLHLLCSLDLSDDEIDTLWPDLVDRDVTPAAPGGGGGQPPAQMSRLGLVDAASCNEAVLGGLLNDPALAARIVAARPTTATPSVAWLVHALSKADADRIGTLLTCGSFQFRADLLAVSRSGSGWARLDAYITCETSFPTITHLRPAEAAGWPLPWATPSSLRRTGTQDDPTTLLTNDHN